MATTEKSLDELLDGLNEKSLEENYFKWTSEPIEAFPSYTVSMGGTSHPSYGAVPNVTIGTGTTNTTSNGLWINNTPTTIGGGNVGPVWTTTNTNPYTVMGAGSTSGGGKISLEGENADLLINKKSLRNWMEKVEERLNILTPNPELEKEWDQLRRLGERYRKLEKKCKEQSDMWNKLKNMSRSDIT
jgi:hypothetical protein